LQTFAQLRTYKDIIEIKIKITDDRAQKTTFDVSPSIGKMDLKLFHNIDLTNTPDQVRKYQKILHYSFANIISYIIVHIYLYHAIVFI